MERARATTRFSTPSGRNSFTVAVAGSTDVTVPKRGWLPPWSSAPGVLLDDIQKPFHRYDTVAPDRGEESRARTCWISRAMLTEPRSIVVDVIGLVNRVYLCPEFARTLRGVDAVLPAY